MLVIAWPTTPDFSSRTENKEKKQLNIIRIGTSGSLQPEIGVDSFVASTHGIGLDNLLHFYPYRNNEVESEMLRAFKTQTTLHPNLSSPYITSASAILLAKLVDGCHAGITATCPGFYAPQGRNLRLGLSMPQLNDQLTAFRFGNLKITNFEMETAAIYGLGKMMGHHCLSLSAIVANRIAREFSADADATIDKLIRQVLEKV
jgi:uridine phosphorylase